MTAQPNRSWLPQQWEQVEHELAPLRVNHHPVALQLGIRRAEDGAWRGWLRFVTPGGAVRQTAEIFCAESEAELWQAVRALGDHHLRALYTSLA
jgi:hypothetical protein